MHMGKRREGRGEDGGEEERERGERDKERENRAFLYNHRKSPRCDGDYVVSKLLKDFPVCIPHLPN